MVSRIEARDILKQWASWGKGVVTSSNLYDFRRCDFEWSDLPGRQLLGDLPHAVVAINDMRSFWLRILACEGIKGSTQIKVTCIASSEAPDLFGFLVFRSAHRFPLVIVPCLLRAGTKIHMLGQQLFESRLVAAKISNTSDAAEKFVKDWTSLLKVKLATATSDEVKQWIEECAPSSYAAFDALRGLFPEPPPHKSRGNTKDLRLRP